MQPDNATDQGPGGLQRLPDQENVQQVQCSYCERPASNAFAAQINQNGRTIVKRRAICAACLISVFDRCLRDPIDVDMGVDA